ncbi:hypothetical protein [Polynucleobacter sp. CS-Odin-A6]|uniref:hypothetical protein n=1 Tax=Polynucleobacter sp. CS-Odin-A6 TaxID=2689106 RepID=UPI001C0B8BD3|nr:hypothetical protein [Polynucleobacter sp. CS-Odin-A6]MBU3620063.1 magnesium transporter [Polynucleobacter sp. CS-Odin-A6]
MKLLRHYFISNNLDDLDLFEKQLGKEAISPIQIHVLSNDVEGVLEHPHLYGVGSFMKLDIVRSGFIGAAVGACIFSAVLMLTQYLGWYKSGAGWVPFIFLALILFWFCVWEGGFIGIQRKNTLFGKFKQVLKDGLHVFYIDLYPSQELALQQILKLHPEVIFAGTGKADPHWLVVLNQKIGMI